MMKLNLFGFAEFQTDGRHRAYWILLHHCLHFLFFFIIQYRWVKTPNIMLKILFFYFFYSFLHYEKLICKFLLLQFMTSIFWIESAQKFNKKATACRIIGATIFFSCEIKITLSWLFCNGVVSCGTTRSISSQYDVIKTLSNFKWTLYIYRFYSNYVNNILPPSHLYMFNFFYFLDVSNI